MIWSEGDGVYLAQVKELPGCLADGATAEEAFQNIRVVMQEWLETAKEEGREIPEPLTLQVLEKNADAAHQEIERQFENRVREAVDQVLQKIVEQGIIPRRSWPEGVPVRFEPKLEKSH